MRNSLKLASPSIVEHTKTNALYGGLCLHSCGKRALEISGSPFTSPGPWHFQSGGSSRFQLPDICRFIGAMAPKGFRKFEKEISTMTDQAKARGKTLDEVGHGIFLTIGMLI